MPKRTSPSEEGGGKKKRRRLPPPAKPPPPRFEKVEDVFDGLDGLGNVETRVIYGEWNKHIPHRGEVAGSERHSKNMRDLLEKAYPTLIKSLRVAYEALQELVTTLPESIEHNRMLIERLRGERIDYRLDILTKNRVGLVDSWYRQSKKYLEGLDILKERLAKTIERCTLDAESATTAFQELHNNLIEGVSRLENLPRANNGTTPLPTSRGVTLEYKSKLRLLEIHYNSLLSISKRYGMINSLLDMEFELTHRMHYTEEDQAKQREEFLRLIPLGDHVVPAMVLNTLVDCVQNDTIAESAFKPSHDFAEWRAFAPSSGMPLPLVVNVDPDNQEEESPYVTTILQYALVNVRSTETRNHMIAYEDFCSSAETQCFSPVRVQRWEILPTFWLYVTEHECDPTQMTTEALINGCQDFHILFTGGASSQWKCITDYSEHHNTVPAGLALNQSGRLGEDGTVVYSGTPPVAWLKNLYRQPAPVTPPSVPTSPEMLAFLPVSHPLGLAYPIFENNHLFYTDAIDPPTLQPTFRLEEEIVSFRVVEVYRAQTSQLVNRHAWARVVSSSMYADSSTMERVLLPSPSSRCSITLRELGGADVPLLLSPCKSIPEEYCLTSFRGHFAYDNTLTAVLSEYNPRLPEDVEFGPCFQIYGCFFSSNKPIVDIVGLITLLTRMGEERIDRLPSNFLDYCVCVPHIGDEFLVDIVAACMTNNGLTIREVRGSRSVCHHVLREICIRIEAIADIDVHPNHRTCLSFADAEFIYFFREADACSTLTLARVLEALTQGPLLHACFRGKERIQQTGTILWSSHLAEVMDNLGKHRGGDQKHSLKIPESFMSILSEPSDQELIEFVNSLPENMSGAHPFHTFHFHVRQNRSEGSISPSSGKGVLHTALAGFFYHLNRFMLRRTRPGCLYFTTWRSEWPQKTWQMIFTLLVHGVLKGADVSLAIHPAEFLQVSGPTKISRDMRTNNERLVSLLVTKLERIYPMEEGVMCNRAPTHYHPGEDLERALSFEADAHLEASMLHRYGLRIGEGLDSWSCLFPSTAPWLSHRFFCAPNPRDTFTSQAVAHALAPVNFPEDSVTVSCVRRWVEGLSPEALRVFCFFATGKRTLPSTNTITLSREHPNYARFDKLPIASTCSSVISMPDYDTLKPEGCSLEDLEGHIGAKIALAIHSGDMALD